MNLERKKEQLDGVSYDVFEVVMDRLEKEWFDLVRGFQPSWRSTFLIVSFG